ncbi:MAG: GntG family PLP-dependent aldolase [Stellaceae bacterium]
MNPIDLRSDTVTRPSAGMREAMAAAPVGDDQYGEDPSVNLLQERVAELLGKEAALFVPSGTMANQIGLRVLTRPGDEVVLGHEAHIVWHESGAGAANSGVQFAAVGQGGLFTADDLRAAYKPPGHIVFPPTTLVAVENTHNRGGGVIFPQQDAIGVCAAARELGMASYLDGARLFNAAVASGRSLAELAAPFDLVSVALSKGLGCPVGSVLAGKRDAIARAHRARRMFGGAMRQAGILAAAGLWALDHKFDRLAEDHANARLLAERLEGLPGVELDLATVQSNIVIFHMTTSAPDAATIVAHAAKAGVLVSAFADRTVRAVTHLDVAQEECRRAADILAEVITRTPAA